jgi:glycosyltransferase 2 family protein
MTGASLVFGDISSVLDAIGQFFENLAAVEWIPLIAGLVLYGLALTSRSRGSYNVLRAAYPAERFRWLPVWGAYVAAYGANAVFPARPGDIVRLFLLKRTVPNSHYPTLYASFLVENIFDWAVGIVVLIFAFTQGVFPKPPDFSKLDAFDLSYFAAHPQFTLFVLTVLAIAVLIAIAWLSARVKAFWARVRQGWTILRDKRRYLREVVSYQALAWALRFGCFWLLLEAFGIPPSIRNVLLVFGVAAVSSLVPLTPGGAGVQQALLVKVFAGSAAAATVASYSVGQQIAIAAFSFGLGLVALIMVFQMRSFRQVIRLGKAERAAAQSPS